ncbi:hypothetical protein [Leifsonia sp. NPDC058248]|uniref:hypothetical protein n=1 Tax=Leifsonia sp. NPDC058248 TaxID=3346402 RepID=UPI0036DBF2BC
MSAFDERTGDDREDLEGTYTESNDEGPEVRTVHGQYTESAEFAGPEPDTEGSYVDSDEVQEVSTEEEPGDYTETEPRRP